MIELIKEYFSSLTVHHIGNIILIVFAIINNLVWLILMVKGTKKSDSKHFLEKVSISKRMVLNVAIWILKLIDVFIPMNKLQNLIQRLRLIRDKVKVDGKSEHKDEAEGLKKIKELEEKEKIEGQNQRVQLGG